MDDLISEFITETNESLATLDLELVTLEQNPEDKELLGSIFRLMHTIKGTCGFLGLPRLEHVAHKAENLLGKFRDGELPVTPEAVTLILNSIDRIKMLIEHLGSHGSEPEGVDEELVAELEAFYNNGGPPAAAGGTAPAADATPPAQEQRGDLNVDTTGMSDEEAALAIDKAMEEAFASAPGPDDAAPAPAPEPTEETPAAAPQSDNPAPAPEPAAPPPAPAAEAGGDSKKNLASQSIRVNLDVLEDLMQMVSELVLTRNQLLQLLRHRNDTEFATPLQRLSHITTELQEGVMKTRMQPIGNAWAKFPRLIRDLSIDLGKKIELRMVGAETELDRQLLEMIKDPLTHMVRNSADHGLETPEVRAAAGKPETGTVVLRAFHEGGHIIVEIADDGKGIDVSRIKEKSLQNGLASQADLDAMTDQQILQFIFKPGFSTAERVTSVSGRGVGMDVVKTNIEKIGGTVDLKSVLGKGSTFQIKIPLTLAIVSVLIVETCDRRFAIPQISVMEMVRASDNSEHTIEKISDTPVLRLRERLLPLISLAKILGLRSEAHLPSDEEDSENGRPIETYIVVCKVGAFEFGILVDRVFNTEEIVVKPLAPILQNIDVYSGSTILGDGSVIMILDPNGLAKTTGELQIAGSDTEMDSDAFAAHSHGRMISFLLFRAGEGAPKAVPLELVSRLEELRAEQVEYSGPNPVIQYRGQLMRLVPLSPSQSLKTEGIMEAIVFNYGNQVMGLIVDAILDIVEQRIETELAKGEPGCLGSTVIAERTTDIIDVAYYLEKTYGDLEETSEADTGLQRGIRVLLVDDSSFYRNLIEPIMTMSGFTVKVAETAEKALQLLEEGTHFDVVVTDIQLPGMDGFEMAQKIRSLPAAKSASLIAYTSNISAQDMEQGRELGFQDFVSKSNKDALIHAVRQSMQLVKGNAA